MYRKQEIACKVFCSEIECLLDEIFDKADVVIIVGDFNVWAEMEDNVDAKRLAKLMNAYGLTQLIKDPTHIDGHTLDHLYVNEEQMRIEVEVENSTLGVSDHYPCTFKIPALKRNENKETIQYRNIKKIDLEQFKVTLKERMERTNYNDLDFESCYGEYKQVSEMLLDEVAPIQTKSIVKRQRPKWVDEEFNQSKILRRKLERIWRKNRTEENHQKYVQQRKQCADLSISKQKDYYSKLVDGSSGNQRSLFKVVEEMLDRKSERVLPEHTDPVELAMNLTDIM